MNLRSVFFTMLMLCALFCALPAFAQTKPKSSAGTNWDNPAPTPNEAFQNFIESLTFVSADDIRRGWGESPIDMKARRKFFTHNFFTHDGWSDYKAYVAQAKKILKPKQQMQVRIDNRTQKYTPDSFIATGHRLTAFYDAYDAVKGDVQISIKFTGDVQKPESIQITAWSMTW